MTTKMNIEKNSFVSLTYELRTTGADGELVEKVDTATPLQFVFGSGRMLEAFEQNIEGLTAGNDFKFKINCKDAYGEVEKEAIVDLPKNIFIVNGELRSDLLVVGKHVPMMGDNGQHMMGIVLNVGDNSVTMDFNHPLAGEDLYFSGTILEVREATADELIGPSCGGGCGGCGGGCGEGGGCGDGGCCGGCN